MLKNILLVIVLSLMKAGEYYVSYCHAISECWRIFCWLLSCLYRMLRNILLVIALLLVNAREYFLVIVLT